MTRMLSAWVAVVVMWLAVTSAMGSTLIQPKGDNPEAGYPFAMLIPCPGSPSKISQIAIDTREEAAAVSAYVEGRLPSQLFIQAMVAADPFWRARLDALVKFSKTCEPQPSI